MVFPYRARIGDRATDREAERARRAAGRKARAQSIYFSNEARIALGDGGCVDGDLQGLSYSTTDADGADHRWQ